VRVLNRVKQQRGVSKFLFYDNGSEFTTQAMDLWAYQNGIKIDFSRPGKPTDNAFVESFNGTFRSECFGTNGSAVWRTRNESLKHGAGIQCESSSQGSRLQATRGIRQSVRG
jgi:transposase InsO family protein